MPGPVRTLALLAMTLGVTPPVARAGDDRAAVAANLADLGPAPAVQLIDQDGEPFDLASRRGKVVLVGFIYTTCGGVCPATTHRMVLVQEALKTAGLWGTQVEFVSISLDPVRDDPAVLRGYARVYDADPQSWHFLTGPPDQVTALLARWDMWARVNAQGVLDHPSRLFLLDPRGHRREIYNLEYLTPATVLQDVRAVLNDR